MSKRCSICGKKSKKSASRSHSNIKTIRRQKPNLQWSGEVLKCSRCIRTEAKKAK